MNEFIIKMQKNLLLEKEELLAKSRKVDVDTDGDEIDEIQANMLMSLEYQLTTRDFAKIANINAALDRITDSTYGICEDCDCKIPEKRLTINPYFITCVDCAEQREDDLKAALKEIQ